MARSRKLDKGESSENKENVLKFFISDDEFAESKFSGFSNQVSTILDVQTQPGQEVERSVPQGQCLLEIDNQCEAQSKQTEKGPGKTKKR